jgi:transcription initiation factor TFIID TATA-box-binding protein
MENMVASAYFNTTFDLDKLAKKIKNSTYDKKRFPALVIRYRDPPTTVLLFSTGKAVITGAKNEEHIHQTALKLAHDIFGENAKPPEVEIVNVVYTVDSKREFNLDELAMILPNCEYEPDQFTGLIFRPPGLRTVLLVFTSGKMVCPGAKSIDDVLLSVKKFFDAIGGE